MRRCQAMITLSARRSHAGEEPLPEEAAPARRFGLRRRRPPREADRSLVLVAFVPAGIAAACAVVLAALTLLTGSGGMSGLGGAAGGMWMALHQAPVYIGGLPLAALPLLPTVLLVAGVAAYTRRFVDPGAPAVRHAAVIGAAAGGPAVVTVAVVLVMDAAWSTSPVSTVGALPSVLIVMAVHGAAALLGVGVAAAGRYTDEWALPPAVPRALRAGALAFAAIAAAGTVLVVLGLLLGWSRAQEAFAAEPSFAGRIGLLVLSVLYLPNLAVGAAAVLVGTPAHVGDAAYSLFAVTPGPLPALPVSAALPDGPIGGAWPAALAVPAAVALWCAARRRGQGVTLSGQARYAVSVAAIAGALALVAGYLAGGDVGVLGAIGVDAPSFALAVLAWNAAAGLVVVAAGRGGALAAGASRVPVLGRVLTHGGARAGHPEDDEPGEQDRHGEQGGEDAGYGREDSATARG